MKKICTITFPFKNRRLYLANKKEGFGKGFLNGYGGKQEPSDETIEDTAIREIREEAGVIVSHNALMKVAIIDFFKGGEPLFECHVFLAHDWEGDFVPSSEMDVPEQFDLHAIPFERMWDADRVWVPLIFASTGIRKIRAWSYYTEDMKKQIDFKYEDM